MASAQCRSPGNSTAAATRSAPSTSSCPSSGSSASSSPGMSNATSSASASAFVEGRRTLVFSLLATEPLPLEPEHAAPDWLLQKRHILCDEQQPDRQQLDPQHGQEPEQAARDEQQPERDAHPAARRAAQPADSARHAVGRFALEHVHRSIQLLLTFFAHEVCPCCPFMLQLVCPAKT